MKGKRLWIGVLAVLLVFSSVGFAHADAPGPLGRGDRRGALIKGEVTAIDGDALTVQTGERGALTVQIAGSTQFRAKDDPNFTLVDLEIGDEVAVRGRFDGENTLIAQVVLFVPADLVDDVRGRVVAIEGQAITVEDKAGKHTDVITSDETGFRVKNKPEATLADIQVGMLLGAAGQFDASGALVAKQVIAGPLPERKHKGGPIGGGEVSSANGNEFVIKYLDGSSLTITTGADTLVITRGDAGSGPALGSLSDVKAGVRILVFGVPSSDGGELAARVILVGQDRP